MRPQQSGEPARLARHRSIGEKLEALSDAELVALVGAGGAFELPASGERGFAKLIPLTEVELRPEYRHSTANLFELPTVYQNRFGSCGFGAWRELELHRRANEWVRSGRCTGLTLLHDWRVLPIVKPFVEEGAEIWGDDPSIRARVAAIAAATSSVVLFLEHVPQTLYAFLGERLRDDADPVATVAGIETELLHTIDFLNGEGVLHMDAHFENVLTDGEALYLTDHGLGIATDFDLRDDERAFFERHQSFDRCTVITACVYAVAQRYAGDDPWRELLRGPRPRILSAVPARVREYLRPRVAVAIAMGEFYGRLRADLTTAYPTDELQRLLAAV